MHPPHRTKGFNILSCIERTYWTGVQFRATRMHPQRVHETQRQHLRQLLQIVRARSAFYREKFHDVDANCSNLAEFPVTTKAEMMNHFDQVVTDPAVTRAGWRTSSKMWRM